MNHINIKIKLFIILIVAFIGTQVISKTIFLSNSPRLNPAFFIALRNAPFTLIDTTRNFLASLDQKQSVSNSQKTAFQKLEQLPVTALNKVGTGVYAQGDTANKVIYIKITKDAEWEEKTIIYNDKQIKVRFPKGTFK